MYKGRIKFLDLGDKGIELLKSMNIITAWKKKESAAHEYWKHKVAKILRQTGYDVEIEKRIEDSFVDVVASKNGETTAIEIETRMSDAVRNAVKISKTVFDKFFIVALGKGSKHKLRIRLENCRNCQSVQLLNLNDFLTLLSSSHDFR